MVTGRKGMTWIGEVAGIVLMTIRASFPGRARRAAPRRVRRRSLCLRSALPATSTRRRPHRPRRCSRAVRARCTTRRGSAVRRSRSATAPDRGVPLRFRRSILRASSPPPVHPASRPCAARRSKLFVVLAARAPISVLKPLPAYLSCVVFMVLSTCPARAGAGCGLVLRERADFGHGAVGELRARAGRRQRCACV